MLGRSPTGSPSPRSPPAGAAPARSTPSPATPGAHPRITHGALIHHVHAAPSYERHPRARGPRRARAHPPWHRFGSPIRAVPRYFQVPRHRARRSAPLPLQTPAANHRLATPQDAFQAGGSRPLLNSKRGAPSPKKRAAPSRHHHPTTPPLPPAIKEPAARQRRQGSVAGCRCDPARSRSAVMQRGGGGGCGTPPHAKVPPLPAHPRPPRRRSPVPWGGERRWPPARHRLLPGRHRIPTGRAR